MPFFSRDDVFANGRYIRHNPNASPNIRHLNSLPQTYMEHGVSSSLDASTSSLMALSLSPLSSAVSTGPSDSLMRGDSLGVSDPVSISYWIMILVPSSSLSSASPVLDWPLFSVSVLLDSQDAVVGVTLI